MDPKHEHKPGEAAQKDKTRAVTVTVTAPSKGLREGEHAPKTMVALFGEDDAPLGFAPVERGVAKFALPAELVGRTVRVLHAPVEEAVPEPSIGRLRRRGAIEDRLIIGREGALKLPPVILPKWKLSCCRARGRVVVKVTLPNGTVQERPLCNARVVICEVDYSIRGLIQKLPNDLIFRIRDEFLAAVPPPVPPIPPVMRTLEVRAHTVAPAAAPAVHHEHATGHTPMHAGEHPPAAVSQPVARERLVTLAGATAVELIRDALIDRINILKPVWCLFDWLTPFYRVDTLKTVEVDENGYFDTDIEYPCYGDRPDLYFKVEQDCHPGGWLTVHAPPVQCNTHWDYCCGTSVKIVATHPDAAPGRAPAPCVWPYTAGDPASVGSWELLPYDSGVFVVHGAVMPSGKVLMFSGTAEANLPKESRVWDPTTGILTTQSFGDDLFCAGHAMLADGRVLVNGGAIPGQGRGIKATHVFDPTGETWTKIKDMNHARWYPTTLTLPDGRILTFSGRDENAAVVSQAEVYDPTADTWTDLPASANKSMDIYPSLHLMPDGTILYTGTRWSGSSGVWMSPPASARLNLVTNTWTDVDDHEIPDRTEGCSILLPPYEPGPLIHEHDDIPKPRKDPPTVSRVLVVGGHGATATAEIIDMAEAAPAWRRTADMNFPRRNVNSVLLPDGKVLICSGIQHYKWDGDPGYVYEAELFDPQMETWTKLAGMTVGRQYHSVSLLLPDARVLNVGSQSAVVREMRMEVYSPPYLFHGPRPKISAAPATVGYGAEFVIDSPDSCRIDRVVFIRPSSVTHHTNTDQRYLPLKWHRDGHCGLRATAPPNANIAPPGYYMLFILDDCGVPSVARLVRLG
jgi:hypothetical protein